MIICALYFPPEKWNKQVGYRKDCPTTMKRSPIENIIGRKDREKIATHWYGRTITTGVINSSLICNSV